MGLIEQFQKATVTKKLILIVKVFTVDLAWISFITPSWGEGYPFTNTTKVKYGLWQACSHGEFLPSCTDLVGWDLEWYIAVQAMATLGFLCVNLGLLFLVLLMFVPEYQEGKSLTMWAHIMEFFAALFYLPAIIIFAVKFDFAVTGTDEEYGFGWILAIVVTGLEIFSGLVLIYDVEKIKAKTVDL